MTPAGFPSVGCLRGAAIGTWFGVLLLGAMTGCGKPLLEPGPDLATIRGEPIESAGLDESWQPGAVNGGDGEATTAEDVMEAGEGPIMVEFDRLAGFEYAVPESGEPTPGGSSGENQIPPAIRALNGCEVGVRGFMLPLKVEGGLVQEFLLMRDQSMCCFGVVPRINEWVAVTLAGRGVRAMMDQPVTVFGRMHVGEVYAEGVLSGIYRMEAVEVAGPLDL